MDIEWLIVTPLAGILSTINIVSWAAEIVVNAESVRIYLLPTKSIVSSPFLFADNHNGWEPDVPWFKSLAVVPSLLVHDDTLSAVLVIVVKSLASYHA